MENLNLHKQKMIAIIIAAVGLLSFFLPWWHVKPRVPAGYENLFNVVGAKAVNINGLHKLGIVAFIALIGVIAVTFAMGDKTKAYEGQEKMIAAGCFGASALFTLITLLANSKYLTFGIFIALAAAVIGALFVWGMVKMPETKMSAPAPPK